MRDTTTKMTIRDWLVALALLLSIIGLYSINLEQPPHPDELYHMLAAKGLLETGEPAIGTDGRYWRGYPLTWIVAQSIDLFGLSLSAGRLPPLVFMALLCSALFLFLRREAGPLAAWLGTALFTLSPFVIDLARFIRFYSLQCLLFFLAAWIIYALAKRPEQLSWRALPAAALAIVLLGFATYLQATTLFGIAGLGAWLTGLVAMLVITSPALKPRQKQLFLATLAALGILVLLALWALGILDRLLATYRTVALFNESNADRFWYYAVQFALYYPLLMLLSGFIVLYAYAARPRLTIFLSTLFLLGFLLNSFAASKSLRYLAYAQPFLFALWGTGLAALLSEIGDMLQRLRGRLAERLRPLARHHAAGLANALLVGAGLIAILGNPAWLRSLALIAGFTLPMQAATIDGAMVDERLRPWIETVDAVVTTNELFMLYYYDRADYLLSASKFREQPADRQAPFVADFRTDVPVIATTDDLRLVFDCYDTGLFVALAQHWLDGAQMRQEVVDAAIILRDIGEQIELPRESGLVAFVWQHHGAVRDPAACAVLPS